MKAARIGICGESWNPMISTPRSTNNTINTAILSFKEIFLFIVDLLFQMKRPCHEKTIHLAGPPTKSATDRRLKDLFFYFSSKLFSTSIPQESFLK